MHTSRGFQGGTFRASRLGPLRIQEIEAAPHRVEHQPNRQLANVISVLVTLSGEIELQQDRTRCTLGPQQMVLTDSDRPFSIHFASPYKIVFVLIPTARLGAVPLAAFGQPMSATHPLDRLLFEHVTALPAAVPCMAPSQHRLAIDALAALLRLTTAVDRPEPARSARVARAMQYLGANLDNPQLSATEVAAAQQVSRRFLDGLFRAHGTTVERAMWEQRLERAAALLGDEAARAESIASIAWQCGFRSTSHFSRAFRARFGVAPSCWRDRRAPSPRRG